MNAVLLDSDWSEEANTGNGQDLFINVYVTFTSFDESHGMI